MDEENKKNRWIPGWADTFFLFQKPFCKQKPLRKNAAQKEPVLRKKKSVPFVVRILGDDRGKIRESPIKIGRGYRKIVEERRERCGMSDA